MLINVASQRQVVDRLRLNDAILVDQESPTHGDVGLRMLHAVGLGDAMIQVGDDGELDGPNATFIDGRVPPGMMREL